MGTSLVQSQMATAGDSGYLQHDSLRESRVRVGSGSQGASQVQRNQRRPSQRQEGLLLLSHGLADVQETS